MSAARDRLKAGYWNSLEKTASNPGGMADFAHRTNFPLALQDVGNVGQEIVDDNDATKTATLADNAATKAAILADNTATKNAIVADNSATKTAILTNNAATADAVAAIATAANNSKVAAAASEANAASSAGAAAISSAGAIRVVTANFPDRLDAAASFFTEAVTGDPAAVASAPGAKIINAAGVGYVYRATGAATLAHKGVVTAGAEYVIEIAVEVEQVSIGGGETPAARIRLQGLDKDYASTGAAATSPLVVTPVGVTIITRRFGFSAPASGTAWPQPGVAVWLRPAVDINRKSDDSGAAAASVAQVRRVTVRDVTAVVAAELAAAAAATSANSVAQASQADAEAGVGAGLMSATRVGQAINKLAIPIGGVVRAPTAPSAQFLVCDGASYLKASYPTLAAALGDKYASYVAGAAPSGGVAAYVGGYAETNFAIAVGGATISSWDNTNGWTVQTTAIANFTNALGVVKTGDRYFVHGYNSSTPTQRCLIYSTNGLGGWFDAASFGTFSSGAGSILAMAYGVVGGTSYVVALGGGSSYRAQLKYSSNNGGAWTEYGSDLSSGFPTMTDGRLAIAGGVLGVLIKSQNAFWRSANMTTFTAVTPVPAAFGVGNNLFVCVSATGDVTTSPDLVTFTPRDPPRGFDGINDYLGYFNGEHYFSASVSGRSRYYATTDFSLWRSVKMPASVAGLRGTLMAAGASTFLRAGALCAFAHNPATQFPVPNLLDEVASWIKAL